MNAKIQEAKEKFGLLLEKQLERNERIKSIGDFTDYAKLDKIIIGICGGDGIGPIICKEAERVLRYMLADEVASGKVEFKEIDGLTIENRVAANKAIPDIIFDDAGPLPTYIQNGWMYPLTEFVKW